MSDLTSELKCLRSQDFPRAVTLLRNQLDRERQLSGPSDLLDEYEADLKAALDIWHAEMAEARQLVIDRLLTTSKVGADTARLIATAIDSGDYTQLEI